MITAILIASCSWAVTGANPYQGSPAAAVDAYTDIAPEKRKRLKSRMALRQYDDIAVIARDSIQGSSEYINLRDMWFGRNTVCGEPDRTMWSDSHTEIGLVYCEGDDCLIVPTVCKNVSRVTRVRRTSPMPPHGGGGSLTYLTAPVQLGPIAVVAEPTELRPSIIARWALPPVEFGSWAPTPIYLISSVPIVPEPSTLLLTALGLATLLLIGKRRA